MKEVSVADFEKNFDTYMDRIENGRVSDRAGQPDGRAVVAVQATTGPRLGACGEDEVV